MKKERRLTSFLFVFGICLLIITLATLGYQIYILAMFLKNGGYDGKETAKVILSYAVTNFVISAFKIILSSYAIASKKHLDEVLNILFFLSLVFLVFVILEAVELGVLIYNKALEFNINTFVGYIDDFIDIICGLTFPIITLSFKIDDWRMYLSK